MTEPSQDLISKQLPKQSVEYGESGQRVSPGLYIVATPIGNLRDITLRALDILTLADTVYCEDTRVAGRLLSFYGLNKKLERCDDHTETRRSAQIIEAIKEGKIIAYLSDAGTPGISDPGSQLAAACHVANVPVSPIPGPSAAIAAMSAAGIENGHFIFLGFLPPKSGARRKVFQEYQNLQATIILYEAPQRVAEMLEDITAILGEREVIIAREITKLHEKFYRGTPVELMPAVTSDDFKGEVVVLIPPALETANSWTEEKIDQELQKLLQDLSLKEAVAKVTALSGLARKVVYARALGLKDE